MSSNQKHSQKERTAKNSRRRILWNKPIDGTVANSLTLEDTNYIYSNYTQFTGVFVKGSILTRQYQSTSRLI
jgi:hypothetical protein